jgi:hypothetical protein
MIQQKRIISGQRHELCVLGQSLKIVFKMRTSSYDENPVDGRMEMFFIVLWLASVCVRALFLEKN